MNDCVEKIFYKLIDYLSYNDKILKFYKYDNNKILAKAKTDIYILITKDIKVYPSKTSGYLIPYSQSNYYDIIEKSLRNNSLHCRVSYIKRNEYCIIDNIRYTNDHLIKKYGLYNG